MCHVRLIWVHGTFWNLLPPICAWSANYWIALGEYICFIQCMRACYLVLVVCNGTSFIGNQKGIGNALLFVLSSAMSVEYRDGDIVCLCRWICRNLT